ncbi:MAG: tripartite tricarboxylate transporter TctB family protein [Deltaproteobacteria bacterium]|nr:tripartite tricarboxylate transporter TctB family protein [Deltaproteobacteria bacterium]
MFLAAAFAGWDWPDIAKIMPVYRDATGWEGRRTGGDGGIDMDETYEVKLEKKTELRRTLAFFAWFTGGALGIWLLGIVITLPLLIFLYALVEGKEKWLTSLIMAGCAYALVWGLFEYMLETRWPPGMLFG